VENEIVVSAYFSMLLSAAGINSRVKWDTAVSSIGQSGSTSIYDLLAVARSMAEYQMASLGGRAGVGELD